MLAIDNEIKKTQKTLKTKQNFIIYVTTGYILIEI